MNAKSRQIWAALVSKKTPAWIMNDYLTNDVNFIIWIKKRSKNEILPLLYIKSREEMNFTVFLSVPFSHRLEGHFQLNFVRVIQ